LQVPTLLDMTTLEPAPPEPTPKPSGSTWGLRHQLRLLGIVLVLTAVGGGTWLYVERPVSRFDTIDPENIRQTAKSLSPSRTWDIWQTMQQGLDRRTDQQYAAAVLRFRAWQVVIGVVALLGVALIAGGTVGGRD
jgi:hypothetical protein